MSLDQEVVITGLGVVSPIGIGLLDFWNGLTTARNGVMIRAGFGETELPLKIVAPVVDFDARQFVKPRKAIKIMCNPIQFGCAAAGMAVEQARLENQGIDPDRIGTLFGTETFFADPNEVANVFRQCTIDKDYQHDKWGEYAMRHIQPLWMLKYLPNMAASHISISLDARGHSNSICQGEASGLIALIEAANVIQRGACDVVVAGGTGSFMELTSVLYRGGDQISRRVSDPRTASRPFERDRDGMVAGEGAAAIVLESAEHAARRGARVLARLSGWSHVFQNPLQPDFDAGIEYCFRAALKVASKNANEMAFVNADAGGRVKGDEFEAKAIQRVFGNVPVVAHKSNFGNLGPGTSTVETVGTIMSLGHRVVPPSLNYEQPDPSCPVNMSRSSLWLDATGDVSAIKSSISSTGQIASMIFTCTDAERARNEAAGEANDD